MKKYKVKVNGKTYEVPPAEMLAEAILKNEKEGKLLLICDGMNGQFLRLVKVDKFVDGGSLGDTNEFVELPMPGQYDPELLDKIKQLYFEYTGKPLEDKDIKYAMWTQWY